MQPLVKDAAGVVSFQANEVVKILWEQAPDGFGGLLEKLRNRLGDEADFEQFLQLIGVQLDTYFVNEDVRGKSKAEARNKAISLGLLPPE